MQIKTKKALSASTIASLLITSSVVSVNVKAATVTPPENPRLWGADRYETAVKVSQAGWTSGSDYAILASGEGYADALCAAPLAKANNAPILLTQKGELNSNTLKELKRLNVKHVFIVGGQGVVSQEVENKIKTEVTSDIQRLWGQNRYETSVKVAQKLGSPTKVVLASGDGYADALSAAPVAAIEGMPILLTESKTLSKATADYIKSNTAITKTYVIGGTASVSDAAMNMAPKAQRFSGSDRFETNAAVIKGFDTDFNFKNAYVALGNGPTGNEFADALAASALAAKNSSPVIITNKVLGSSTQNLAKSKLYPSSVLTVIGGAANVPNEVVSGMKITASFLSEAGKTYSDEVSGNAEITADNVTLKGNVKGDLYLSGNNASLSSIKVDGTVYVNPGATGVSSLDTVTAKNIVILSGAKDSIHLKNVKADKLTVISRDNVRITSEGTTAITNTVVASQAILEATSGSFGTVNVPQTAADKTVEFRGTFDKAVVVEGNVNLKTAAGANLAGLVIADAVKESEIKLDGNGTIKNIQVKNANTVLNIDKNISVTGKIETVNKNNVKSENSSITGKVEEKSSGSMSDITGGGSAPSTGGGSSSSGSGGGTSYKDITADISVQYGEKIQKFMNGNSNLKNYFEVTTGSTITVQLKSDKVESLSSIFENADNAGKAVLEARLNKVQQQIDLHLGALKIDGMSLKYQLAKVDSIYINNDGSLNTAKIAEKIASGTLTYADFKTKLKAEILASIDESKNSPDVKISGLKITMLQKDGVVIYDSALARKDNIDKLFNMIDKVTGDYNIYNGVSGTDYIHVRVLPKQ